MMEFVSWDDDIPNIWKVIKFHGSKPAIIIQRNIEHALQTNETNSTHPTVIAWQMMVWQVVVVLVGGQNQCSQGHHGI